MGVVRYVRIAYILSVMYVAIFNFLNIHHNRNFQLRPSRFKCKTDIMGHIWPLQFQSDWSILKCIIEN